MVCGLLPLQPLHKPSSYCGSLLGKFSNTPSVSQENVQIAMYAWSVWLKIISDRPCLDLSNHIQPFLLLQIPTSACLSAQKSGERSVDVLSNLVCPLVKKTWEWKIAYLYSRSCSFIFPLKHIKTPLMEDFQLPPLITRKIPITSPFNCFKSPVFTIKSHEFPLKSS